MFTKSQMLVVRGICILFEDVMLDLDRDTLNEMNNL